MIKIDLVLQTRKIEWLQCKSRAQMRIKVHLCQNPSATCEIRDLHKAVAVLESDDRGIGAKLALVVHG